MKTISLWAFANVWPARIILAICHIVLILMAWLLVDLGSAGALWLCAIPFIVAAALYIFSRRWCSRSFHLFAATGSFWLVTLFFQSGGSLQQPLTGGSFLQQVHASMAKEQPQLKKKKSKPSFFKRITGDKTKKTLLSILTIIVALGLLFLIAALSCSIACSGAEALALLVGLAGLAAVIFFTRRVLRRIKFGPRKKDVNEEEKREEEI